MKQVTRRRFIKNAGGTGIALWLGLSAKGNPFLTPNISEAKNFTPHILVESTGNITIYNTKPEMGQGIFTAALKCNQQKRGCFIRPLLLS